MKQLGQVIQLDKDKMDDKDFNQTGLLLRLRELPMCQRILLLDFG